MKAQITNGTLVLEPETDEERAFFKIRNPPHGDEYEDLDPDYPDLQSRYSQRSQAVGETEMKLTALSFRPIDPVTYAERKAEQDELEIDGLKGRIRSSGQLVVKLVEHLGGSVQLLIDECITDPDDCAGDFALIEQAKTFIEQNKNLR